MKKKKPQWDQDEVLRFRAQKSISKEIKTVKAFFLQKQVRKCKKLKEVLCKNENTPDNPSFESRFQKANEIMSMIKGYSGLEAIQKCMKYLGLEFKAQENKGDSKTHLAGPKPEGDGEQSKGENDLTQRIMEHPRTKKMLEDLLEVVDERRRDKMHGWKKRKNKARVEKELEDVDSSKGIFIELGEDDGLRQGEKKGFMSGHEVYNDQMFEFDEDLEIYGPRKKNRPGQRQRQQKMKAIQASKSKNGKGEGLPIQKSIRDRVQKRQHGNGGKRPAADLMKKNSMGGRGRDPTDNKRPPIKKHKAQNDFYGKVKSKAEKPTSTTGKEDKMHPSWAARKMQKEKEKVQILPFAGKKITFGDDDG